MRRTKIVWTNDLDYEDYREGLEERYPYLSEDKRKDLMYHFNEWDLEDIRNVTDKELDNDIVVFGDLGLWWGRTPGYKEIGKNLSECLYSDDDILTWFVDDKKNLRCDASHHDGMNHYLYRVWKDDTSEVQKRNLLQKQLAGKVTRKDITRLTRSVGEYFA